MRVAIGVNGKGYGHVMRQACLLPWLLERGHQVAMLVSGRSAIYFGEHFADVPCFCVKNASLIPCSPWGFDFGRSAQLVENRSDDFFPTNYSALAGVLAALGGLPDLVLTDYEPVAAILAYSSMCPLITIDNQSSFLGFCFPPVQSPRNGALRTRDEERRRLNLFFPKAEQRFAVSFLVIDHPPDPSFPVTIIPPMIRREVRNFERSVQCESRKKIVVYLSSGQIAGLASSVCQTVTELLAVFGRRSDIEFLLFTDYVVREAPCNVIVRPFDSEGLPREMSKCSGVIATAGHTLLAEVVYFRKPILALPVDTFEQISNAKFIESAGIGLTAGLLTPDLLNEFVAEVPRFQEAYEHLDACGRLQTCDGTPVLAESLRLKYGL